MTVTVTRLYSDYAAASRAVNVLEAAGVPARDISLVASNADNWYSHAGTMRADKRATSPQTGSSMSGVETGAGVGTAVGGAAGLLTGLGLLAIPGVGPVVAAGWLVATAGWRRGGRCHRRPDWRTTDAGVSEDDAHVYAEGVRRGGSLVTARVPDADKSRRESILDHQGSIDVRARGQAYRTAGWKTFDDKLPPYTPDQVRQERGLYRRDAM
jgi:hypothetical protein